MLWIVTVLIIVSYSVFVINFFYNIVLLLFSLFRPLK